MGVLTSLKLQREKRIPATLYEKLKHKRKILFEFLEDLNECLIHSEGINLLKEVLIKEIFKCHKKHKKKNKQESYRESMYKEHENKSKDDLGIEKVFYAIYDDSKPLGNYQKFFAEKLQRFNRKKGRIYDTGRDKGLGYSQIPNLTSMSQSLAHSENTKKLKKSEKFLLETHKNLLVHTNHYKAIFRKMLFSKFQRMGIWVRQTFSQDNRKILMLLKLQGESV